MCILFCMFLQLFLACLSLFWIHKYLLENNFTQYSQPWPTSSIFSIFKIHVVKLLFKCEQSLFPGNEEMGGGGGGGDGGAEEGGAPHPPA